MQHQNNSLTEEYPALQADIQPGLQWADRVFGGPPEATNLWIGDDRSVTSFHKGGWALGMGCLCRFWAFSRQARR